MCPSPLRPEPHDEKALAESCIRRNWIDLLRGLADGCPVDERDGRGVTPLQVCAASGWTEGVALLLKHGANVHLPCPLGWTALMQAVRNGHVDVVEILLAAGASASDRNSLGWDAVCLAVESQNKTLLTLLVSMANASELTPALTIACQLGRVDLVTYLLQQGADFNGKLPVSGLTPLMLAACEGHMGVVEVLLSHGANPHTANSAGLTALDMALMKGHGAIGAILSIQSRSSIFSAPTYPHSPLVPLTKPALCEMLPITCPGQSLHPCTLVCHTPGMQSNSPDIFKFPPSPTCVYASPNLIPHRTRVASPHPSPTSAYGYLMPHNTHQCFSPSQCSSPMIPPWMFAYGQWHHKMEPKLRVKSLKTHQSWWQRLKRRLKRKMLKKKIRVYVTYDEAEIPAQTDPQFEALLSSLNLSFLIPLLKSHEIDLETFLHLREADLQELGIVDKALQLSVLQKINNLNSTMVIRGAKL